MLTPDTKNLDAVFERNLKIVNELAEELEPLGFTYYDLSVGSHVPDEDYCKFCQKWYRKIDGHWRVFCGGCNQEFKNPSEDGAHVCEARQKLKDEFQPRFRRDFRSGTREFSSRSGTHESSGRLRFCGSSHSNFRSDFL